MRGLLAMTFVVLALALGACETRPGAEQARLAHVAACEAVVTAVRAAAGQWRAGALSDDDARQIAAHRPGFEALCGGAIVSGEGPFATAAVRDILVAVQRVLASRGTPS